MPGSPASSSRLPAAIVGGYLGAGKTTLVNHLLRHADGRRIAVLVNDFGELGIDADLIEGADGEVLNLAGGCVCCSFGSDLVGTLAQVIARQPPPDVLLIETSGVGLPAAVARTARLVNGLEVTGIGTGADAQTLRTQAADRYVGDTVRQQLAEADLLVLNKTDAVDAEALQGLREWLPQHSPGVRIVETAWGAVMPEVVFGITSGAGEAPGGGWAPTAMRPAPAAQGFESGVMRPQGPVDLQALVQELTSSDSRLVRAKGFVTDRQGVRHLVQVVGQRAAVTAVDSARPAPAEDALVWIRCADAQGDAPD